MYYQRLLAKSYQMNFNDADKRCLSFVCDHDLISHLLEDANAVCLIITHYY